MTDTATVVDDLTTAIHALIDSYTTRVPAAEQDSAGLAFHIANGLSDESERLAEIEATAKTLITRWREYAASAALRAESGANARLAEVNSGRAHEVRRCASDLEWVLTHGQIPHPLMTDAELEQHGPPAP